MQEKSENKNFYNPLFFFSSTHSLKVCAFRALSSNSLQASVAMGLLSKMMAEGGADHSWQTAMVSPTLKKGVNFMLVNKISKE